jgi:hypothetical protein
VLCTVKTAGSCSSLYPVSYISVISSDGCLALCASECTLIVDLVGYVVATSMAVALPDDPGEMPTGHQSLGADRALFPNASSIVEGAAVGPAVRTGLCLSRNVHHRPVLKLGFHFVAVADSFGYH